MKKGFETGLVYAGAVIGAGFASGRELWQFFGRFGTLGILGLLFSFMLYFVLGYTVFYLIGESRETNCFSVFGKKGRVLVFLNFGFMFVLFVSMTAAAGAMGEEILGLKRETGSLIFCLIIYFCTFGGKSSFLNASNILTPVLVLLGAVCGILLCPPWKIKQGISSGCISEILFSGLIYVSYNVLSLTAVMFPFKENFKDKRVRFWGSFFGSVIMFILGVCLFPSVVVYYKSADKAALPILNIMGERGGGVLYGAYAGVLFAAVFTTAAGNFFGFSEELCRNRSKAGGEILRVVIIILGYAGSLAGFSEIISIIYPFFGILGLLNILFIVYNSYIKKREKR